MLREDSLFHQVVFENRNSRSVFIIEYPDLLVIQPCQSLQTIVQGQ